MGKDDRDAYGLTDIKKSGEGISLTKCPGGVKNNIFLPHWFLGEVEIIAHKGLLGVLMSQDQLVLLHILDLSILRYTFLVVRIVVLDGLNRVRSTSGKKGAWIFLISNFYQSIFLKNGWYLTSSMPLYPNRYSGRLWINLLMNSTLSRLQP